jgi:hypothetical protein
MGRDRFRQGMGAPPEDAPKFGPPGVNLATLRDKVARILIK